MPGALGEWLQVERNTRSVQRVDELLHSLREHGTLDSQGEFTVSLSEARRKLKQYHSSEPARYVLLLVSAGFASGGRSAAVTRRDHCLTIRFPGAYLSENELLQALDNPHNSASSAALQGFVGVLSGGESFSLIKGCPHPTGKSRVAFFLSGCARFLSRSKDWAHAGMRTLGQAEFDERSSADGGQTCREIRRLKLATTHAG